MYTIGPIGAAVEVAHTAVTTLTGVLSPVAGGAAAALAIVCLIAAVRSLLLPFSYAQVRGERVRTRLAPRLQELRRRHASDPQRLVAEQQRLYQQEGASPLSGCLPTLVQLPVFLVLYGVFTSARVGGEPNSLLAHTLGGVPLGTTLTGAVTSGPGTAPVVFAVLLVVLTAVAWASRRWLTLPALAGPAQGAAGGGAAARLMSYLPFGTVAVAAFVPLAAGLYLVTTTAWTLAERLALRQFLGG